MKTVTVGLDIGNRYFKRTEWTGQTSGVTEEAEASCPPSFPQR
jgi:hypothetical protein